jgi:PhnB protein
MQEHGTCKTGIISGPSAIHFPKRSRVRKEKLTMSVKPIPDGYHSVTPYLVMKDATSALDFYRTAFGAKELFRMDAPGGRIGHAEMLIGDSHIMLADEAPEMGAHAPGEHGAGVSLLLYVEDADAVFARSVSAGATELRPMKNQFYGDRSGMIRDPFGHTWSIATHVEDVSPEEMDRRAKEAMSGS